MRLSTNRVLLKWVVVLVATNVGAYLYLRHTSALTAQANTSDQHSDSRAGPLMRSSVMEVGTVPNTRVTGDTKAHESGVVTTAHAEAEMLPYEIPNRPDRVYCIVPFLWNKSSITGGYVPGTNRARYNEIMDAWGQRCDTIRFFIDPIHNDTEEALLPPNLVTLKLNRTYGSTLCGPEHDVHPCKHIWEKVWRSWVWVASHEAHLAEWFVKLDDDSFLFPENLRRFVRLKGWSHNQLLYFGNKCSHRQLPIVLGAGVVFSQKLLLKSAKVWSNMPYEDSFQTDTCADVNGMTEEVTTAVCLNQYLLTKAEAAVWAHREMILPKGVMHHLWGKRNGKTDWYWKGRDNSTLDGGECCSAYPIVFHQLKGVDQHSDVESMIYGNLGGEVNEIKGKAMQPEYYRAIINNLRILAKPLVIAYTCDSNKIFVQGFVRELFPERHIILEPAATECGRKDSTGFMPIEVLVGPTGPSLLSTVGKIIDPNGITMNPKPFLILLDSEETSPTSEKQTAESAALSSIIDLSIRGNEVTRRARKLATESQTMEWKAKHRMMALKHWHPVKDPDVVLSEGMDNLEYAARKIRIEFFEGVDKDLVGDEVHY